MGLWERKRRGANRLGRKEDKEGGKMGGGRAKKRRCRIADEGKEGKCNVARCNSLKIH